MNVGDLRHLVTLDNPGPMVPDGRGGFTQSRTPLSPLRMWADIRPATVRDLERAGPNAVQSTASHVITMRYHSGITTQTRITKGPRNADDTLPAGSREFNVTGVQNPEERNIELRIAAEEVVA